MSASTTVWLSCDVSDHILQVNSDCVMETPCDDEQLSQKLSTVLNTLTRSLDVSKAEEKPTYWKSVTKTINTFFFVFYLIAVIVFLAWIFFTWTAKQ